MGYVYLQCHGERPLLGIVAGQRHPGDVQRLGDGPEYLREDDAEVAGAALADAAENPVQDVA